MRRSPFAAALALALCAAPAGAELALEGLAWESAAPGEKGAFSSIERWRQPPDAAKIGRLRALATIENRGKTPEGTAVLRFTVTARLARIGGGEPGAWSVPFLIEDTRSPLPVKADSRRAVPLVVNRVTLAAYLRRVRNQGLWPDAFRIQALLEPRKGETLAGRVRESELPVDWK